LWCRSSCGSGILHRGPSPNPVKKYQLKRVKNWVDIRMSFNSQDWKCTYLLDFQPVFRILVRSWWKKSRMNSGIGWSTQYRIK
jgi:hypothetical protein